MLDMVLERGCVGDRPKPPGAAQDMALGEDLRRAAGSLGVPPGRKLWSNPGDPQEAVAKQEAGLVLGLTQ